jgi:pSer/pThr/pTyr-binding forkhead associated (FHA) protein
MNFSLIVVTGATAGKEIPIRMPEFVIGRDPECHLRPASPLISKKHCAFINRPDKVVFKDFGSTNGSFINDVRVVGEQDLKDGDVVKFGPLLFRTKIEPSSVKQVPISSSGSETISEADQARTSTTSTVIPKGKKAAVEDDIAAMLFNFADAPRTGTGPEDIPTGSTIAMAIDSTLVESKTLSDEDQRKADEEAKRLANRAKVQDHAATSKAAQAILDKYMRRPR